MAVAAALAGGVGGWFAHAAWLEGQVFEARQIASGEHESQQAPGALRPPAPADETEAAPEAGVAPAGALPQQGEAFVDRFEGDIGERWTISDGWSNGTWMANDWRRSEVEVRPGLLTLHLRKGPEGSGYPLAGGEVQTHARHRYGYFEVRMKVPRGSGTVTGFFSYAHRQDGVRPNEIDIEILGRNTRVAELTIHENNKATATKITLPFDAADGFHTYGFDWQPDHVRWYADGVMIHEERGGAAKRLVRPQQLILSLWASEQLHAWVGRLDVNKAPWRLDISCAAYAPTYGGELCAQD